MRRFSVCANNYQLFAQFLSSNILLSTIMQKYLLLLVCLIATMNARAGITVVPPTESESGAYELTFSSGDEGYASMSALPEYVKNATSLKIITKNGYKLSHNEMATLMGNSSNSLFKDHLQRLDMGDAELDYYSDLALMTNATESTGLIHLKYFVFPKNIEEIPNNPKGMFEDNKVIEEVIMLERDDTNKSGFTTIPANTFKNASNLSKVRIPEGVTTIGPSAFAGTISEPAPPLETIHFPNSLQRIENSAFAYNHALKSVTVPANVNYIGNSAFQKNDKLEDVYVLGNRVETFDGSFNEELTYDGFSFVEEGTVTIDDWKSIHPYVKHPARLHIPNNPDAYKYCVNPFLRALNDLTLDELNNLNSDDVKKKLHTYGIKTDDMGALGMFNSDSWVVMDGHRYFKNREGMFNQYCYLLDPAVVPQGSANYQSFNGWHNFMFVEGDIEKKTWPDTRMVESRWYSAVFPFDLSFNQVETTYGANTDVREFTNVYEHTDNGKTTRTVRFNTRAAIPPVTTGAKSVDKNKPGYIVKGRPYMIHPGTRVEVISVGGKQYGRTIAGVDVDVAQAVVNANTDLEEVKRPIVYTEDDYSIGTEDNQKYFFKGTYLKQDMPKNSFYLGYEKDVWPLAFYVRTAVGVGKWSAFTSIVQKTDGSAIQNAKPMDLDFTLIMPEEENFGIATNIESVAEQKCVNNGVVYNLNGQVIGNQSIDNLSKGIYIVNGKKIVVR